MVEKLIDENQQEKVHTLVRVLQLSRDAALKILEKTKWNVEEAIARILDGSRSGIIANDPPSSSTTFYTASAASAASANLEVSSTEKSLPQTPWRDCLSQQWHSCDEKASTPFVNPDFPPTQHSLDGRKSNPLMASAIIPDPSAAESDNIDSSQPMIVKCHCGILAASKKVQSDGPN